MVREETEFAELTATQSEEEAAGVAGELEKAIAGELHGREAGIGSDAPVGGSAPDVQAARASCARAETGKVRIAPGVDRVCARVVDTGRGATIDRGSR